MKPNLVRALFILLIAVGLTDCKPVQHGWKTIEIGRYVLDVPNDFELQPGKGVDSAEGLIKSKRFTLQYDYGAYSDSLPASTREYLQQGAWKLEAIVEPHNIKKLTPGDWMLTKVLSYRPAEKSDSALAKGCDYVADCSIKNRRFYFPVYLPQEIKSQVVAEDTIHHNRRRMLRPLPGWKGITGIYMRDMRGTVDNGFVYPGLHIIARDLNTNQQGDALAILATLRPKQK